MSETQQDEIADIVHSLIGYQMTLEKEEELQERTGRDAEDVALDYNVERCRECGIWNPSCEINANLAADGEVICVSCVPEGEEDER